MAAARNHARLLLRLQQAYDSACADAAVGGREVRARGCLKMQHNLCEADTNSRGAVLAAPRLRTERIITV